MKTKQPALLEALRSRPLVCDGAMGTQLMARGLPAGVCGMLWNVEKPGAVLAVHREYRAAACDLLTTNSFGGSRSVLSRHGLGDRVVELNLAAAHLARQAADSGESAGWVLGDVGPFGDFLEPLGDTSEAELEEIFGEQISALEAGGADAILIETMSDPAEVLCALRAARHCAKGLPAIVTYAFQKTADGGFRTLMGTGVEEAIGRAVEAGAELVGANCGTSLDLPDYVALARMIVKASAGRPVIMQPNAGSPHEVGGRLVYDAGPEAMANAAREFLEVGVRVMGGCCGTTPGHLHAIHRACCAGSLP